MNVAAVQFKAFKGDKAASLSRLTALTRQAANGADLVVLPEMAATGYLFESRDAIAPHAESADGVTFDALAPIARDTHCWIVCGLPERAGDRLFNSALVIDPEGALRFCYRKTLLYDADKSWADAGDSGYRTFDTGHGTFTVGICMDLNDDRFVAWCHDARADAIAFPTNWLDEGVNVWGYWAWRLKGIPSALVAANTYGAEGEIQFVGRSAIIAGRELLAHGPAAGDSVLRATIPVTPRVAG